MTKKQIVMSLLAFFLALAFIPLAHASDSLPERGGMDHCDFKADMRKLWEDHITWTRLFIVDASANLPETKATTERLLRNQQDIGDAVKPFYGNHAGNQLAQLLTDHILIAAKIVNAAKAGNNAEVAKLQKLWMANANDIAFFLHNANPDNWPLKDLQKMMQLHLKYTTEEVVAHLNNRFDDDIAAYDRVHFEILDMSDMLADGIINQFPQYFN